MTGFTHLLTKISESLDFCVFVFTICYLQMYFLSKYFLLEFNDKYAYVEEIGQGGFGEVWQVIHEDTEVTFAMKIQRSRLTAQNEISILKSINHEK